MNTLTYQLIIQIAKANVALLFVNKKFYQIYMKYCKDLPLFKYQVQPTNANLQEVCRLNEYTDLNFDNYKSSVLEKLDWNKGLTIAITNNNIELTKLLYRATNYRPGITAAIENNSRDIIEFLMDYIPASQIYIMSHAYVTRPELFNYLKSKGYNSLVKHF